MKKFIFALTTLFCVVTVSCTKASEEVPIYQRATLTAGFGGIGTKTTLNSDRTQSWLGGETIKVIDITDIKKAHSDDPTTYVQTIHLFTNSGTSKSSTAMFIAEEKEFSFIKGHTYIAVCNVGEPRTSSLYRPTMYPEFVTSHTYCSSNKYGLQDGTLPLACLFIYEEATPSILFKNLASLIVLRITNTDDNPKTIHKISISSKYADWPKRMTGSGYFYIDNISSSPKLTNIGSCSDAKTNYTINFDTDCVLAKDETKDFGFVVIAGSPFGAITAKIYSAEDSYDSYTSTTSVTESTIDIGDVKVWSFNLYTNVPQSANTAIKSLEVNENIY